jgi:hypothetical protein
VRLDAELQAHLEELRESRARIVEVGYAERRRMERDLHDGAQQRLVALALDLQLARSTLDRDPAAAADCSRPQPAASPTQPRSYASLPGESIPRYSPIAVSSPLSTRWPRARQSPSRSTRR